MCLIKHKSLNGQKNFLRIREDFKIGRDSLFNYYEKTLQDKLVLGRCRKCIIWAKKLPYKTRTEALSLKIFNLIGF